jgi:uncharacterized protein YidB (DUF937 family)
MFGIAVTRTLVVVMDPKALWGALPRPAKIYLAAVGAVAVAGLAGVVTVAAASPSPSPSASATPKPGQAYCSSFTGHLANNLGKSQSQVQKAISDALGQTLDDAVKNGDLTQKQADAIKARMSGQACPAAVPGIVGRGGPGGGFRGPEARRILGLDEYAKALGISTAELQQDLQNGKTVKDIAASKGMDEAAFRSKLAGVAKSDLDTRVKDGNLTQKQEDEILQHIQNGPLPLWDRTLPKHLERPGAPAPAPKESPTTG